MGRFKGTSVIASVGEHSWISGLAMECEGEKEAGTGALGPELGNRSRGANPKCEVCRQFLVEVVGYGGWGGEKKADVMSSVELSFRHCLGGVDDTFRGRCPAGSWA